MAKLDLDFLTALVKKKDISSSNNFLERLRLIQDVHSKMISLETEDRIANEVRRGCVVSIVTALEVFYKDIIIQRRGYWDKEGIDFLMKESISLKDAFRIARIDGITEEHVIAMSHNFQNFSIVVLVFSKLLGSDLIKGLQSWVKENSTEYFYNMPRFHTTMEALLTTRHEIIHEGRTAVEEDDYFRFLEVAGRFAATLEDFIIIKTLHLRVKGRQFDTIDPELLG